MAERTKYEIKGKKGIDDLWSIYAFSFNDGGGGHYSNDISWYEGSNGWVHYDFGDVEMTDEAIAKESERRRALNEAYINQLYKEGKYGEEYIQYLELEYNPLYDGKQEFPHGPLESYKMVFLDFSHGVDEPNIITINRKEDGKPESET